MRAQSPSQGHSDSVILTYICQLWFCCVKNKMVRAITILASGKSHEISFLPILCFAFTVSIDSSHYGLGKICIINIKTQSNSSRNKSLTANFVVFSCYNYNYMCHIKLDGRINNRMKYYLSKHIHLMKWKINIEKITDPFQRKLQIWTIKQTQNHTNKIRK